MSSKLDRVNNSEDVFLGTIELDVEAGRFPDVLVSFFGDAAWDYTTRFYVAPICKEERPSAYVVGVLVFEMSTGQLARLLALNDGLRWGAGLRIGGIQVPDSAVAAAIKGSPFDPEHAAHIEPISKLAWAASANLDELSIWTSAENIDLRHQVTALFQ